jgi:hypothetical protein
LEQIPVVLPVQPHSLLSIPLLLKQLRQFDVNPLAICLILWGLLNTKNKWLAGPRQGARGQDDSVSKEIDR